MLGYDQCLFSLVFLSEKNYLKQHEKDPQKLVIVPILCNDVAQTSMGILDGLVAW